ncbi:unnamed protein product [Fusarium graminearum]|uniref:Uncharacterized protein n=1 Tax=Gibberella zeae TaxID=5518 RepID=A0A4E9DIY6_GIBZA|nr:unnamed protein product [Fusarium graminearum]CAG1968257.1 unnamed protein product [Fusarium graminearum]
MYMPQSPAADTNSYAAKIPREKHRGSETSGNRVNGSGRGPGHTDMSEEVGTSTIDGEAVAPCFGKQPAESFVLCTAEGQNANHEEIPG